MSRMQMVVSNKTARRVKNVDGSSPARGRRRKGPRRCPAPAVSQLRGTMPSKARLRHWSAQALRACIMCMLRCGA